MFNSRWFKKNHFRIVEYLFTKVVENSLTDGQFPIRQTYRKKLYFDLADFPESPFCCLVSRSFWPRLHFVDLAIAYLLCSESITRCRVPWAGSKATASGHIVVASFCTQAPGDQSV